MRALMVQPETWKAMGAVAEKVRSILGPLAGVFVGASLAGRGIKGNGSTTSVWMSAESCSR